MKNTALARARIAACRLWPAATSAILSLVPVERRGLGTVAVDKHWRIYFDPDFLSTVTDQEAAVLVLHEVSHLLLRHHERGGNATDWELWNIAADCAVNYRLQAEGHTLPEGGATPLKFQLPGNLSAEQYYRHLQEQRDARQQSQSQATAGDEADEAAGGDPGQGPPDESQAQAPEQTAPQGAGSSGDEPAGDEQPGEGQGEAEGEGTGEGAGVSPPCRLDPGTSGSCADGQLKPWEDPPPAPEQQGQENAPPPVIEKHEQEQLIRRVAETMERMSGKGAGGWSEFVQQILHPKIDPKVLLTMAIRKAVDQVSGGHDDTSYRRPSRRPSSGGVIRPSRVAVVPRICVIVDSSGSMCQRDLGYAVGLIAKVLSGFRLRDGVQVMIGDTEVQSCEQVFDPKKITIKGRGGTDMDKLIVAAAELDPKPQLIVVATDGVTPWPDKPVGVPTVACLTRELCSYYPIPSWIKPIVLA